MAHSEISICNMSLSWLGGNIIISFQDESTEAILCAANYEPSREATLEDREWTFAAARAIPNKLADPPAFGYSSAFQLPTNPKVIKVNKVSDSPYFDTKIEDWVKEGDKILANKDVIYIKYTQDIDDPIKFSPGFVQALAARIAADICVPLTHDVKLFASYWQLYLNKLETAGANDGMQGRNIKLENNQLVKVR